MFVQILSMIRTNSFCVYKNDTAKNEQMTHKEFTLKMVKYLMEQALAHYLKEERSNESVSSPIGFENTNISIGLSSAVSSLSDRTSAYFSIRSKESATQKTTMNQPIKI